MKNIIITAIIASALGLGAGYIFFNQKTNALPAATATAAAETQTWTCAMHPQIQQDVPGLCPICEMDLTPLQANGNDDPTQLVMTQNAMKLANIQTTTIGTAPSEPSNSHQFIGKIEADETRTKTQSSHVSGRLETFKIKYPGEYITKGQLIGTIYAPDLIATQRELLDAIQLQPHQPMLVEAARKKLLAKKILPKTIDQIIDTKSILEYFPVYADHSGVVTNKMAHIGDYVKTGEALYLLSDFNQLWASFDMYETDLSIIKLGDYIYFTTPALPDREFKTKVTFIDPVVDSRSRTAKIRGNISNRENLLKPDMFLQGVVMQKKQNDATIVIPKTAVLWTGKRSVVYTQLDNDVPTFQYKEVIIGQTIGDQYEILSGLSHGEKVVTNGAFVIDAAAQLNNQNSMMNQLVTGEEQAVEIPDFKQKTPQKVQQNIDKILQTYLSIKDALVASDLPKAVQHTTNLETQLKSAINMKFDSFKAANYWQETIHILTLQTQALTQSTTLEQYRIAFSPFSQTIKKIAQSYAFATTTIHLQHCPMALDDQGASWLSDQIAIRNPYYGDKMLKCGTLEETYHGQPKK